MWRYFVDFPIVEEISEWMPKCAVKKCGTQTTSGLSLFSIPVGKRNETKRMEWLRNMGRLDWTPYPSARICELHFELDQFVSMDRKCKRRLRLDAVPTIFDDCLVEELRRERCGEKRKPLPVKRKTGKYERKLRQIKQLLYEDVKYNMELERSGICRKIRLPETMMIAFSDDEDEARSMQEAPSPEPQVREEAQSSLCFLQNGSDPEISIDTIKQEYCVSILKKPDERKPETDCNELENRQIRVVPFDKICKSRTTENDEEPDEPEVTEVARLRNRIQTLELDLATVNKRLQKAKLNNTNLLNALAEFVEEDDIDILREAFDVNT